MPTDISGGVEAEYTATIPVPLDGEYANSTALQNMILPVANRVEFLNQGLIAAPFESPVIREDWFTVEKVDALVHGDTGPWNYAESTAAFSDPVQTTSVSNSGLAGAMFLTNTSGSAAVCQFKKKCLITRTHVRRLSFRFAMLSTAANKSLQLGLFFGGSTAIGSGDTSGFGLIYDPAVHANFRSVGVSAGVYTYVDTGLAPSAGTHYQVDIVQDPDTLDLSMNIQNTGGYTFSGLPLAGIDLSPDCRFGTTNSGSRQFLWDLFYLGLSVSRY